jgi:uncharacterized protein YodC (DUF2158 family)
MRANFETGDKVRLAAGGPVMTVEHCGHRAVHCVWYEGSDAHSDDFRHDELELVLRKEDVPDSRPAPLE